VSALIDSEADFILFLLISDFINWWWIRLTVRNVCKYYEWF